MKKLITLLVLADERTVAYLPKRLFTFLVLAVVCSAAYSQLPQIITQVGDDTLVVTQYDTVVLFHHPDYQSCSMNAWDYRIPDTHFLYGSIEDYYDEMVRHTKPSVSFYDSIHECPVTYGPRNLSGSFFGRNSYWAEAYAQPFHFDSVVTVIGVAAQVIGDIIYPDKKFYITTEKYDFSPLASAVAYPAAQQGTTRKGMGYYFFDNAVSERDFFIVGETYVNIQDSACRSEVNDGYIGFPYLMYNATFSICDTLWQDTIIGCQGSESPWFKRMGVWKRFVDDTVYYTVHKSTLNFNPIIVVPSSASSDILQATDLESTCSVYPNPAHDKVVIQSNFKIEYLELFDMTGKCVIRQEKQCHEAMMDLRGLPAGNYIIRIQTVKGIMEKKVLKQ